MGRPSKHGRLDFDLRKRSRCEPILAKEKRILYDALFIILAPRVGLEPTTCGLTVRRSTD